MYAVIDIGSNTMRLVLYRVTGGQPQPLLNSKVAAGLAGYVDRERQLTPKGIQRAIDVLRRFQRTLESVSPRQVYVFATASLRNIINTQEVLDAIRAACGLEVRVLTGSEEAVFDYFGALRAIRVPDGLMADIGGGSTELVAFRGREVVASCSLPMGSLNLYTKFVSDIVPTGEELKAISRHAGHLLDTVDFPEEARSASFLCGVGGTCRASCALSDELCEEQAGYAGYPCRRIGKMLKLLKKDRERLIRAIIKTAPDRLHTLLPGLAILEAVASRFGCDEFSASPYGVREGYLMYQLEEGGRV